MKSTFNLFFLSFCFSVSSKNGRLNGITHHNFVYRDDVKICYYFHLGYTYPFSLYIKLSPYCHFILVNKVGKISVALLLFETIIDYALFSGPLPLDIGNIMELEDLIGDTNALTGPIPSAIFNNMSSLKLLGLANNKLEGSLPDNICHNLPTVQEIVLAYNQLDGPIPSQWLQCEELQTLGLAKNSFVGSISTSMRNLTNLIRLDLSDNNLTGIIYIHC